MDTGSLDKLVRHLDRLLVAYIAGRNNSPTAGQIVERDELKRLFDEGPYPPADPTSAPAMALFSIGEVLGYVGGAKLMREVHDAFEAKHGQAKAISLSARWDSAAGLWHY